MTPSTNPPPNSYSNTLASASVQAPRQTYQLTNLTLFLVLVAIILAILLSGCTPRVEVAAPDKPITINLNVKIDHEVRVKVDKELDKVLSEDSELF